MIIALATVTFAIALAATGIWRRIALNKSLLDVPNARSSHSRPTPRGGGIAIVAGFFPGVAILVAMGKVSLRDACALIFAGGIVAIIGLLDDFRSISVSARLLTHLFAGVIAVMLVGGAPPLMVFGRLFHLSYAGDALAIVYLVWLLNLYNFMDGIDGIAAMEAMTVCTGAALVLFLQDPSVTIWPVALLLGSASLGFFRWNFPRAKVFLGDVGSGFLGFSIGVLSLITANLAPRLLWSWLILLGIFIVDTSFTVARRLLRGQRIYMAHRSHGYQHAARKIGAHHPVTLCVAAINVFWLLPLATAVGLQRLDGPIGILIAYIPLTGIAWWFSAGAAESEGPTGLSR